MVKYKRQTVLQWLNAGASRRRRQTVLPADNQVVHRDEDDPTAV